MLTSQILQSTIDGFREITGTDSAVYDINGKLIAQTGSIYGVDETALLNFASSALKEQSSGSFLFCKAYDEGEAEYIVVVRNANPEAKVAVNLIIFQLKNLMVAYKEKFDKDNFIKNLLLDNLLLIDIYNRAKKLHIDINVKRAVFIVEIQGHDSNAQETIKQLFQGRSKDFITTVDETNVIIIKEIKNTENPYLELVNCANDISRSVYEVGTDARVAYGTIVDEIKEVSKSYKEAKLALDVGKIFYADKKIVAYNNLGIGRLIYQLPLNLCRMFISEIFGSKSPEDFDEETLSTIYKFFENNLNVSETSRQLFIHRNTLVYRLDKLQKSTGLDLRVFDDAITFKIAMMVVKYMEYMEKMDY
ncbi:MAG: helix-turn-helix domain-containing protein [Eubacteriales bacterium]|nr:helix-turn-helix domain-containing protein [Eubacteriales bacterium]